MLRFNRFFRAQLFSVTFFRDCPRPLGQSFFCESPGKHAAHACRTCTTATSAQRQPQSSQRVIPGRVSYGSSMPVTWAFSRSRKRRPGPCSTSSEPPGRHSLRGRGLSPAFSASRPERCVGPQAAGPGSGIRDPHGRPVHTFRAVRRVRTHCGPIAERAPRAARGISVRPTCFRRKRPIGIRSQAHIGPRVHMFICTHTSHRQSACVTHRGRTPARNSCVGVG